MASMRLGRASSMTWSSWFVAAVTVACLTSGCALIQESIDIKNQPEQAASPGMLDGTGIVLEVEGSDARIQHKDRVATKKNGYGVELARITSTKHPVELVRSAVEQQLKACGVAVGPGGAVVTTELLTFYSDFKPAFLLPVADSASEVTFNLKVASADGGFIYGRTYRGTGTDQDVLVMTPRGARVSLEKALSNAVRDMTQDQALMSALRAKATAGAGGVAPAARPTVATPAPAVAPSPVSSAVGSSAGTPAPVPIPPGSGLSRSRL